MSWREGTYATRVAYAALLARSNHTGIVRVLLMEGSVWSVGETVNQVVWRAVGTRAAGDVAGGL